MVTRPLDRSMAVMMRAICRRLFLESVCSKMAKSVVIFGISGVNGVEKPFYSPTRFFLTFLANVLQETLLMAYPGFIEKGPDEQKCSSKDRVSEHFLQRIRTF